MEAECKRTQHCCFIFTEQLNSEAPLTSKSPNHQRRSLWSIHLFSYHITTEEQRSVKLKWCHWYGKKRKHRYVPVCGVCVYFSLVLISPRITFSTHAEVTFKGVIYLYIYSLWKLYSKSTQQGVFYVFQSAWKPEDQVALCLFNLAPIYHFCSK